MEVWSGFRVRVLAGEGHPGGAGTSPAGGAGDREGEGFLHWGMTAKRGDRCIKVNITEITETRFTT